MAGFSTRTPCNGAKSRWLGFTNAATLAVVMSFAIGLCGAASADDKKKPAANPVSSGWDSKVSANPSGTDEAQTLTADQTAAIDTVNDYFNALANLEGRFVQVDPDKKETKGKFYVQKPGKFRFDYSRPSRKIVVSDGKFLAIQDLDLRNEDVYQLDNTPFRLLLRDDVNILRDARVVSVTNDPGQVSVTLTEKGPDAAGQITVFISLKPQAALTGWVTTDPQGLQTNVTVSDLTKPESLEAKLFKRVQLFRDATKGGSQ
jgi:outer membrane lipoprotein-sorting protein